MHRISIAFAALAVAVAAAVFADPPADTRKVAIANLRSIGQATMLYCAENRGYLPAKPSQLLKYVKQLDVLLDPRTAGVAAVADPSTVAEADKADWADKYAAFILTVPGTRISKIRRPTSTPMWISRIDETNGEMLICFADGHVEVYGPRPLPRSPSLTPHPMTQPATRPATRPATQPSTQPIR